MNLFELQERLKDFSQDQLVREMQAPTGTAPQYLVLSELQRRQRMMAEERARMQQPQTTVAEDAIAAAGVPQGGLADMARAMAPQTDMDMNTAVQPVKRMAEGGVVRMQPGGLAGISRDLDVYSPEFGGPRPTYQAWREMSRSEREASGLPVSEIGGQMYFSRFGVGMDANDPYTGDPIVATGSSVRRDTRGEAEDYTIQDVLDASEPGGKTRRDTRGESPGYTMEELAESSVGRGDVDTAERERMAAALAEEYPLPDMTHLETGEVLPVPESAGPRLSFGDQFGDVDPALVRRGGNEELTFGDIEPTGALIPFALPVGADEDADADVETGASAPASASALDQDKWLALAQAGLALMSSQQPTIGGAIGEAGLAGLTALREAQAKQEARTEREQARADRLAAAARADRNRETYPYRQVDDIVEMAKLFRQSAADIKAANFDQVPAPDTPEGLEYRRNLIRANELTRRALAMGGVE